MTTTVAFTCCCLAILNMKARESHALGLLHFTINPPRPSVTSLSAKICLCFQDLLLLTVGLGGGASKQKSGALIVASLHGLRNLLDFFLHIWNIIWRIKLYSSHFKNNTIKEYHLITCLPSFSLVLPLSCFLFFVFFSFSCLLFWPLEWVAR